MCDLLGVSVDRTQRLFGWSRSARRGTSAWAGAPSHETSAQASPEASDDEDHGDLDDVLGYLQHYEGSATPGRRRSARSSYADLQQLRSGSASGELRYRGDASHRSRVDLHLSTAGMDGSVQQKSSVPVNTAPGSPTLRNGPRERRMSLTDDVEVARISKVKPSETFKEATEDINRETANIKSEKASDISALVQ